VASIGSIEGGKRDRLVFEFRNVLNGVFQGVMEKGILVVRLIYGQTICETSEGSAAN
jgi:hypothetical protein